MESGLPAFPSTPTAAEITGSYNEDVGSTSSAQPQLPPSEHTILTLCKDRPFRAFLSAITYDLPLESVDETLLRE